ncbi:MAG TPA: VWA domain-containing protein [Gemmatimonadales bacterium]|nr:VWA domain-containing protein [Gemmatimonadales bacterium]
MIAFDAPVVLALAPLVGGVAWFAAAWARRQRLRQAALWSAETEALARRAGRGGPTSLALAAFLGTVALAGPRWGEETVVAETRGLDLVIAVDISRSMLAEDAQPSRLGRALREARRLVQDLDGDRIGLIAFAGSSYILSPLSLDGSAVSLYLAALDPDIASQGGTALAPPLAQGGELLRASPDLADRVLVVFTDGEAHDSLTDILTAAQQVASTGVHLILVAEGGRSGAHIPVRDAQGALQGYQRDDDSTVIETARQDDILAATADAAQGTQVAADLPDQAGAVRDLVASYKRSQASETHTQHGRPRAWIALLLGVMVLLGQAATRRTAALLAFALVVGASARGQEVTHPRRPADRAWDEGQHARARAAYLAELGAQPQNDTLWYDAGTAALAAGDRDTARVALEHAAASLDPEIRFRALYNLGEVALLGAELDTVHRDAHLDEAVRAYREALLLRPHEPAAKWNLELAVRKRARGGGGVSSGQGGGGAGRAGGGSEAPEGGGSGAASSNSAASGEPSGTRLSPDEADQILSSIGQEELRTRLDRSGRRRHTAEPGIKNW